MPSVFAGAFPVADPCAGGEWNFDQLELSRGRPVSFLGNALSDRTPSSPMMRAYQGALDRPLALQLHSEFHEELDRSRKVVDHDADMVHAFDRHGLEGTDDPQQAKG